MYKNRRILAVIPARGGSKGIKLKNLRTIAGKSLVAWAGTVVNQCSLVDRKVISTDHQQIADEAVRYQIEAPFMRPEKLSGDFISDLEVLTHALRETEKNYSETYDVILMLQPTSPARTAAHIEQIIKKLVDEGLDAVWTLSVTDLKFHPLKQLTINEQGVMEYFLEDGKSIIARQQLKPVYHRNGIGYVFTRECLLEQKNIKGTKTGAIIIEGKIPNIDTLEDLDLAEHIMMQAQHNK
jgi:CMP-N,N'-diacetyllegionaminic acid synthase